MGNNLQNLLQDAVNKVNEERVREDEKRQKELEEASESKYETYLFYYDQSATDKQLEELLKGFYIVALDYEKFVLAAQPDEDFSKVSESDLIIKWDKAKLMTIPL